MDYFTYNTLRLIFFVIAFISCINKVRTIPADSKLPLGIIPLGNKLVPGEAIIVGAVRPGGWSEWNDVQVGSKILEIDGKPLLPEDGKLAWKSEEKIHHALGARPLELRILRNHPITLTFDRNDPDNAGKYNTQMGHVGVVPEDQDGKDRAQPNFQPGQPIMIGRTGEHPEHFQLGVVEPGSWAEAHLEPGDSILAIGTGGTDFRYLETDFKTSAEVQAALSTQKNPIVELKVRRKLAEHGRSWRASPKRDATTSRPSDSSPTLPDTSPDTSPGTHTPGASPPGIRSHLASLKSRSVEERLAEFEAHQSHIVNQATPRGRHNQKSISNPKQLR